MAEQQIPRKLSRLSRELIESADYLHSIGGLDDAAHAKITLRDLAPSATLAAVKPISGGDVRTMREDARMSQAVFARHLNLSKGYISQLERGAKSPAGAALVLLDFIRRKGMKALLAD